MRTKIQIRFLIVGVDPSDDVELGDDSNVALRDSVNKLIYELNQACSKVEGVINWNPIPENDAAYLRALVQYTQYVLNVKVAKEITDVLNEEIRFPDIHLPGPIAELFGKMNAENIIRTDYQYQLRFLSGNVCLPCGVGRHKCITLVYCSKTMSTPYEPLIWIVASNSGTVKLNITPIFYFIKENS